MTNIKTILVEDSPQNMEALQTLLRKECPHVAIVGSSDNIRDAYRLIQSEKPRLVFLDIELKEGKTTFELLEQLLKEGPISFEIIFVTAYGKFEYATKAIEYAALDFITKPVDSEKLIHAVQKAEEKIDEKQYNTQINLLLEKLSKPAQNHSRIAFHLSKGMVEFVEVDDIVYLEADATITFVYLASGQKLTAMRNLGHYSKLLMYDYNFFPISNKHLVNLNYVKRYNHGELTVTTTTGLHLFASRRGGQDFRKFLNENKKEFGSLQSSGFRDFLKRLLNK